jgi:NADH dehydrogenase [ubiquinone] 1 alpha subcomplex assembly factor 2
MDEIRQAQIKQLAAAADERWAAKPSYLDAPKETEASGEGAQLQQMAKEHLPKSFQNKTSSPRIIVQPNETESSASNSRTKASKSESPWREARPEEQQAQPWNPKAASRG